VGDEILKLASMISIYITWLLKAELYFGRFACNNLRK
jgi:hypothetical protein